MDHLEEIKSRISIEDLVSQYVQLKRAGKNLKGLCPFHKEKTPSFVVSPEKGIAYCFGCNKGGDIFKFTQEVEGISFAEAFKFLADKANVKLETFSPKKIKENKDKKEVLFAIHEKALNFFNDRLFNSESGKKIMEYLNKRSVTKEMAEFFKLGYSSENFDSLYQFLLKNNFKKEDIILSGLVSSKAAQGHLNVFDKFRKRLIFPIFNSQNRCIAFGGRILEKVDDAPKYLNSPESLIYTKGKVLYGMNFAKDEIKSKDFVIVVEGYMDLIATYFAGVKNVAASSGTALTADQIKEISKFTKNILFCFDSDSAGIEAAKRAVSISGQYDLNLKIVELGKSKDPADFILENGSELFIETVNSAKYYLDYYFDKFLSENDINQSSGVRHVINSFLPILKSTKSSVEKDFYLKKLASRLQLRVEALYEDLKNFKSDYTANQSVIKNKNLENEKPSFSIEEYLLGLFFQYPEVFIDEIDKLKECRLKENCGRILDVLINHFDKITGAFNGKEVVFEALDDKEKEDLNLFALFAESENDEFGFNIIKNEVSKIIDKIRENQYNLHKRQLMLKMDEARQNGSLKEYKELFKVYSNLISKDIN